MTKPKPTDPLDVNARLYRQIARLLDDLESADAEERMTMPQRIAALIAIGRIQKMFVDLRKGEFSVGAGSEVRKYAAAFTRPYAVGGRADNAGTAVELDREPSDTLDIDSDD